MAYTAIEKMHDELATRFGEGMGPVCPKEVTLPEKKRVPMELAVKHFIHERCVDLRFDSEIASKEKTTGKYSGKSTRDGQIPYDMQMDIDRLSFARAIERFMASGSTEDAFDVYFCFLEMFGGGYSSSRRMIELLSEYESTASTMLMSHRDHYSHSVYVFLLGLALFDANSKVRKAYKDFYGIDDNTKVAHHYLQFWGMASLFHDIGYPFEISFEQVKSYFTQRQEESSEKKNTKDAPFICYGNMDEYLKLEEDSASKLKDWYDREFNSIEEWLAYDIVEILKNSKCPVVENKTEDDILKILQSKARPTSEKKFMDHAYFSAVILFKELFEELDREDSKNHLEKAHMDALTAIALHNSLYKREITEDKGLEKTDHAFGLDWHPLAYILQFTDELQCWDRTSYGRNSRTELHSMACDIEFDDDGVYTEYIYDMAESKKIIDYWTKYEAYRNTPGIKDEPKLKKYADMTHDNKFAKEIGRIVALSNYGEKEGPFKLEVSQRVEKAETRRKHIYLSTSNFIHIYDFAAALNAQYNKSYAPEKKMLDDFDTLSLEYKLSNIRQAKKFAEALDEIGCFYTDRPVAYDMVTEFTDEELIILGKSEHKRWEDEKKDMCWISAGDMTEELKKDKNLLREQARMHYDLDVKFDDLTDEEKAKDMDPLNTMMEKLLEFDGIRVYRYR